MPARTERQSFVGRGSRLGVTWTSGGAARTESLLAHLPATRGPGLATVKGVQSLQPKKPTP